MRLVSRSRFQSNLGFSLSFLSFLGSSGFVNCKPTLQPRFVIQATDCWWTNHEQSRCQILSSPSLVRQRETDRRPSFCPESGSASALALLSPVFTLVWREAIQHLYHPRSVFTAPAGNIPSAKSNGGINRKREKNEC